jgi:hypothetical protein
MSKPLFFVFQENRRLADHDNVVFPGDNNGKYEQKQDFDFNFVFHNRFGLNELISGKQFNSFSRDAKQFCDEMKKFVMNGFESHFIIQEGKQN